MSKEFSAFKDIDSGWYIFQATDLKKKANDDIEAGIKPKSNKKLAPINKKCFESIIKVALASFVGAVLIAYFVFVTRNSNQIGNFKDFDVLIVTDSPLSSK